MYTYIIKPAYSRKRYYKTKRRYIVFVGSVLIQFIGIAMPSAMLGIVYVDMTREFRAEASQAALMLSLFRGIAFGGGLSLPNNYTCSIAGNKIKIVVKKRKIKERLGSLQNLTIRSIFFKWSVKYGKAINYYLVKKNYWKNCEFFLNTFHRRW